VGFERIGRKENENMIKDNNALQEQSAQEEIHPVSLDHEELEASDMESVSGGAPETYTKITSDRACYYTAYCALG
jgi:hypothetical protein